ncbi:hypothetical protein PVK06_046856 [Gossypium arboreum]|uniref:Myb/SANT-like domain-containing protein n=1 Tax=Gossypium arboreum TaxID=29729 RepID=A0ABR0MC86_GOSAR|nr:hypothetical protein PVK06_046856 [Gossypium arboreum]
MTGRTAPKAALNDSKRSQCASNPLPSLQDLAIKIRKLSFQGKAPSLAAVQFPFSCYWYFVSFLPLFLSFSLSHAISLSLSFAGIFLFLHKAFFFGSWLKIHLLIAVRQDSIVVSVIRSLDESTPSEIRNNRRFYPYFKDCIGALDGTHVRASVPPSIEGRFRSRKGGTTQNVLAAIIFDLKFSYVLASWEGSAHDSRILSDALSRPRGLRIPEDEAQKGNKPSNTFKTVSIKQVVEAISERFQVQCDAKHVKNHLRTVKNQWQIICKIRGESGFGWDDNMKMITYMAIGSFARTFADIDLNDGNQDSVPLDCYNEEDEEVRTNVTSSGTSKRKRKNVQESVVDEQVKFVGEQLGKIANALEQFTADKTPQFYEQVMSMKEEGFRDDFLCSVFDYLVTDDLGDPCNLAEHFKLIGLTRPYALPVWAHTAQIGLARVDHTAWPKIPQPV